MCIFKAIVTSVGDGVGAGRELRAGQPQSLVFSLSSSLRFSGNKKRKDFSDSLAKHLIRGGNEKSS